MKLPDEMKNVLVTFNVPEKIKSIADTYALHIDQAGFLSNEIYIVLLGLSDGTMFVKNIKDNLNVNQTTAFGITELANREIFVPIRKKILGIDVSNKKKENRQKEESSISEGINKDQILADIENPTPAVHPISIADQTISGLARPREIIDITQGTKRAEGVETGKTEAGSKETRDTVASEFIAGKLTETVSLPSQRIDVTSEKPKKYSVDPYRESLN